MRSRFPRFPHAVLRTLLPRAERDEVLAELEVEYVQRAGAYGRRAAGGWAWRQAMLSAPALMRWSWWRGWSGFEPRANAYRPGGNVFKNWLTDARYATRRLRARPGYTMLAVLTLALGIGGTAAVFGIARPLILDPLPYANADHVAFFWRPGWWNEEEYSYLRDKFPGYQRVAFYRPADVTMRDGNAPTRLLVGISSSWDLFDVLGARPMLGRTFRSGEDVAGAEPVVVVSYGLWRELGGTPGVIGQRITLDGTPRTVVGVMPRGFWFPDPAVRIWQAQAINPQGRNGSYALVGLMKPGLTVPRMGPHVAALVKTISERFKYGENGDKTRDAYVKPLRAELLGKMTPAVVATFTAMALILLIACVNVAALMLGQVEGRSTELSVRAALGATLGRITQQLLIEAVVVGLLAGIVGAGLAFFGFRILAQSLPIGVWADSARFDWTMFAAALAIAMVAALVVASVPLFSLWRHGNLRGALSGGRTSGIQGRGGRLERGLVVAEVALAMLIASGAALLVRSVTNLYAIDPGVRTTGIAVVDVLSSRSWNGDQRIRKLIEAVDALKTTPGVRSVATSMRLPLLGGGNSWSEVVEGRPANEAVFTYFRIVSPEYFETMGMRVKQGRTFDPTDIAAAADTSHHAMNIVVNEELVKKLFPNESPIGRRLVGGFDWPQTIVGVVNTVAEGALTDKPEATVYFLDRVAWFGNGGSFVIRTARPQDAPAVLDDARRTIQRVAPEFAVQSVTTMDRVLDKAVGPARQIMSLLTLLSGLALVLGAIGIYGVISHFAARRKRDWAIRVALGLPGSRVIAHIVRQGVVLALMGIVVGAVAAAALTRLLSTFLYGVSSVDPVAFAGASAALITIGAVAAFVPARRAGTVDPARVLREQ
ncbi:MAG TPA: ADOP family duplicated permease [Gemmatimonadaceae bacterium]|nr:ADOP family duplicated permease [Gemmatimonadaceae bacterium]